MAQIYLHIPYCKQACHYCDFHFSTSQKTKDNMLKAMLKEIALRHDTFGHHTINTIYFGGGTPSILSIAEIDAFLNLIHQKYKVEAAEITLEANPDDLSLEKIKAFKDLGINRLSIGVQSFHEHDLRLMNRAHNAKEALQCLENVKKYFNNISIDLIYGMPESTPDLWHQNLETALQFDLPHWSCYALTVEPKTALAHQVKNNLITLLDEELVQEQFNHLLWVASQHNLIHYEMSNFGKENFFSKNNTGYWLGKPYLGIGPSAHSFYNHQRSWNIANNTKYINSLENNSLPSENETLTLRDQYNEYVMTGLRTMWGVSYEKVEKQFGIQFLNYLKKQSEKYIIDHFLFEDQEHLLASNKGKFLIDGIASDLFWLI